MRETLKKLFEYKAWANGEMLTAMEQLEAGAVTTEIAIRTLDHTSTVDQIFAAHMKGTSHGFASANADRAPSLADLSATLRASDRAYVDYVSTLDEAQLAETIDFAFTDGAPGRMTREEMLMHLIVHGGLHRGQIGWIMTLEGVTPPADGLTGYLHKAEAATRRRAPAETPPPVLADSRTPAVEPLAEAEMTRLQVLTRRMGGGLGGGARLGRTVKFDLKDDGVIFIDGDAVSNEDRPADLTLTLSIDDLHAIARGKLSLIGAISTKRLGLSDMGIAVGLQEPLKALLAKMA